MGGLKAVFGKLGNTGLSYNRPLSNGRVESLSSMRISWRISVTTVLSAMGGLKASRMEGQRSRHHVTTVLSAMGGLKVV